MSKKAVCAYSLSGAVGMRLAQVLERSNNHRQTESTDQNVEDASDIA